MPTSDVALSAAVQRMVRSDLASSGVMFSLDTESGFDQVVFITSAYGLGETWCRDRSTLTSSTSISARSIRAAGDIAAWPGLESGENDYTESREAGRSVKTIEVPRNERRRFLNYRLGSGRARAFAMIIERHYWPPMDIEWAKDGGDGKLYVLQARPETVKATERVDTLRRYRLKSVLKSSRRAARSVSASEAVRAPGEERNGNGHRARRRRAGNRHD
jgi:pyruvate,water dikinase